LMPGHLSVAPISPNLPIRVILTILNLPALLNKRCAVEPRASQHNTQNQCQTMMHINALSMPGRPRTHARRPPPPPQCKPPRCTCFFSDCQRIQRLIKRAAAPSPPLSESPERAKTNARHPCPFHTICLLFWRSLQRKCSFGRCRLSTHTRFLFGSRFLLCPLF
jgi:hypothetical protein